MTTFMSTPTTTPISNTIPTFIFGISAAPTELRSR